MEFHLFFSSQSAAVTLFCMNLLKKIDAGVNYIEAKLSYTKPYVTWRLLILPPVQSYDFVCN